MMLLVLIGAAAIIVVISLLVKAVLTSRSVDDFAHEFCNMKPKKSSSDICSGVEKGFRALDNRVIENEVKQTEIEEDSNEIKSFRKKVIDKFTSD